MPPDFTQPGTDGIIPFPLSEWRRGVVYTVWPESLAPIDRGRELVITTMVRRRQDDSFGGFGELYVRAAGFAKIRADEAVCSTPGDPVHSWIDTHTWQTIEAGPRRYAFAAVATRLMFSHAGDAKPAGEAAPSEEALSAPGGATAEAIGAKFADGAMTRIGEIFNDFDFAAEPGPGLFSYGEYVPLASAVRFEPFMQRAEHRARSWNAGLKIIGREWFCTTSPDLAVIHLYYEAFA